MIGVTILGSTGSIGISTLEVIRLNSALYRVVAMSANTDVDRLFQQCLDFKPMIAVMANADSATELQRRLCDHGSETQVESGAEGLAHIASLDEVECVMAAIVGAAGLLPTLAAAKAGKRILLANKEALVMSGQIFMDTIKNHNAELLPIDSEHNAIFQCMPSKGHGFAQCGIEKILLTASGGPFRQMGLAELQSVTPAQACAHPNWDMGRKISVDSATMMNKGLEVIEACWLFDTTPDLVQVVVHPQSIVHSMVEYCDGSILAQLGSPDMRTPIAYGLAWPQRIPSGVKRLDLLSMGSLDFEAPDLERFPCLALAYRAAQAADTTSAIMNAANECAVDAFLRDELSFLGIAQVVTQVMDELPAHAVSDLDIILADDLVARELANDIIAAIS
ncbi:MAG: 1-deoxy-D-xylulose-5-phosphate reductoisomerase [Gammaproteobacteria bacterium]|nr:1-deoxy-D-xylulose-5-phosphate reductoisomerase [Gammaproteobacteria bacterium]